MKGIFEFSKFSKSSRSSKFSKSVGLLVSAAIATLWSGTAQATNLDQFDRVSPDQASLEIGVLEIGISEIGAIAELEAPNPRQLTSNTFLPSAANFIASSPNNNPSDTTVNVSPNVAVNTTPTDLADTRANTTSNATSNTTANITANTTELSPEPTSSFTSINPAINPAINPVDSLNPANNLDLSAVSTSAGDLAPELADSTTLAQGLPRRVAPFTPTSYVGIGVNLGLSDDGSALGQGRFLIYGKLGITPEVSFRPAVLLGNDTTFLLPITYDFPLQPADAIQPASFVPYVGGGAIVATGSGDSDLGFLLSGGVDLPISTDFTATVGLNVGFIRSNTDFGILLGVAYNISGFRF